MPSMVLKCPRSCRPEGGGWSSSARRKLAVDPQLKAGKTVGDVIAPSPFVAVQPGTAEGARERSQRLGGWKPLAFDHLHFCQFNGNL